MRPVVGDNHLVAVTQPRAEYDSREVHPMKYADLVALLRAFAFRAYQVTNRRTLRARYRSLKISTTWGASISVCGAKAWYAHTCVHALPVRTVSTVFIIPGPR